MFEFIVPIEPTGKARPRMSKFGGVYTPEKTKNAEEIIAAKFKECGGELIEGNINMEVYAYFSIPKSATKKNKALMLANSLKPRKKPDLDNILKLVADSLNGIAYKDDAAVTSIFARKNYAEESKLVIKIGVDNSGIDSHSAC